MSADTFGLNQIGQILVAVKDIDRAVGFYRDVLGMKFLFQFPGMAFFDCGGIRLYLGVAEKPEFDRTSIIYYRVPSMADAVEVLKGRGVEFVGEPHKTHEDARHELWLAAFRDPDGNYLELMSEGPKAVASSQ